MDKPTPIVNSSMLPQYRGQVVRIIGKVHKLMGQKLLIQTSDMGNVEVALNVDTELPGTGYVEVIGKVGDMEMIREFTTVSFGETLDMSLVEQVVQISHQFPGIFSDSA